MKNIIQIDLGRCTSDESQTFLNIYKKITVSTRSGKPVSVQDLIMIASDIYQHEKLTPTLVEKLIRFHAKDIFIDYTVTFDGSILELDGVAIFNLNRLYEWDGIERHLYLLTDKYNTKSDFEFTKDFIGGMVYNPVDFTLKVKPKNKFVRWIKSL